MINRGNAPFVSYRELDTPPRMGEPVRIVRFVAPPDHFTYAMQEYKDARAFRHVGEVGRVMGELQGSNGLALFVKFIVAAAEVELQQEDDEWAAAAAAASNFETAVFLPVEIGPIDQRTREANGL